MLIQLKETIYFDGAPFVAGSVIETDDVPGLGGESLIHRGWAVEHIPTPEVTPAVTPEVLVEVAPAVEPEPAPVEPSPAVEPAPAPEPVPEVVAPESKPTKRKR
jgi:hypothetical protein